MSVFPQCLAALTYVHIFRKRPLLQAGLGMVMPYHSLAQHLTRRRPETEACGPQGLLDTGMGDMFGDSGGVQVTMC